MKAATITAIIWLAIIAALVGALISMDAAAQEPAPVVTIYQPPPALPITCINYGDGVYSCY